MHPRPIAFFSPELVSGGTQRHLLEVLRLIDRSRFTPIVVSAKGTGPLGAVVRATGVELVELRLGPSMASRDFLRCVREATNVLRARRVAVVQYFEWRAGLIAIAAARRAGGCRLVAARRSVPKERGVQRALAELVVRVADRIVVNAEMLRPSGGAGQRTDVIPSGVDTDRFAPGRDRAAAKARLGITPETVVIGTVGRLEPRKGTDTLLDAVAALGPEHSHAMLVVVGEGPLRGELVAASPIAEHATDRRCHRRRVVRGNEQAAPTIGDHLRRAADRGRDHRQRHGHRFEERVRHALGSRRAGRAPR